MVYTHNYINSYLMSEDLRERDLLLQEKIVIYKHVMKNGHICLIVRLPPPRF